jgi:hypothetical protein
MQTDLVEGTAIGKYVNVHFTVNGSHVRLSYQLKIQNVAKKTIEDAICYCFGLSKFELDELITLASDVPPSGWIVNRIQAVTEYLDHGLQLKA